MGRAAAFGSFMKASLCVVPQFPSLHMPALPGQTGCDTGWTNTSWALGRGTGKGLGDSPPSQLAVCPCETGSASLRPCGGVCRAVITAIRVSWGPREAVLRQLIEGTWQRAWHLYSAT